MSLVQLGCLAPKSTRLPRVRRRAYGLKEIKAVLNMRRKCPFMGKARIHAMLARKGLPPERLHRRADHRVCLRARRDPPRIAVRRASEAQAVLLQ